MRGIEAQDDELSNSSVCMTRKAIQALRVLLKDPTPNVSAQTISAFFQLKLESCRKNLYR